MPWWVVGLRLTGLGWYIAFCVAGGVLLGLLGDKLLGTTPFFTLAGTVIGSVGAFWGCIPNDSSHSLRGQSPGDD